MITFGEFASRCESEVVDQLYPSGQVVRENALKAETLLQSYVLCNALGVAVRREDLGR